MTLYEQLRQTPGEHARLAFDFAEYIRHGCTAEEGRERAKNALDEMQEHRSWLAFDLERLEGERAGRESAAVDFAGIEEEPGRAVNPSEEECPRIDAAAGTIKAEIAQLDSFFVEVCRALALQGFSLSGGEISPFTQRGLPPALAAELNELKQEKQTTIPADERLTDKDAAALFKGLAAAGLVSVENGQFEAFCEYFGQVDGKRPKPAKTALKWLGKPKEFAYFLWRISQYMQRESVISGKGYTTRQVAICRAFGFNQKDRENKFRHHIDEFKNGRIVKEEQYNPIAKAINDLPGWNKTKEDEEQDNNGR